MEIDTIHGKVPTITGSNRKMLEVTLQNKKTYPSKFWAKTRPNIAIPRAMLNVPLKETRRKNTNTITDQDKEQLASVINWDVLLPSNSIKTTQNPLL